MSNERTKIRKAEFERINYRSVEIDRQEIEFVEDNFLEVRFELGRTIKDIRDILTLKKGSLLKLEKTAGENVDIRINEECIAKGEVVLIDNSYGIRITGMVEDEHNC